MARHVQKNFTAGDMNTSRSTDDSAYGANAGTGNPAGPRPPQAQVEQAFTETEASTYNPGMMTDPQVSAAPEETGSAQEAPVAAQSNETENSVPDGSINEVLAWVGDDTDRAEQALQAEQERAKPRTTLVERLNEKLES